MQKKRSVDAEMLQEGWGESLHLGAITAFTPISKGGRSEWAYFLPKFGGALGVAKDLEGKSSLPLARMALLSDQ